MEEILNKDNYKSNHNYLSFTRFSRFLRCEAAAFYAEYEPPTTAQLVGSYVDAYFSGETEQFATEHPEIFNSRTGELKKDFSKAQDVINRIEQDELMMHYMSGEKQKIMTGNIKGIPFKIKMDSYLQDEAIVDLKIMKDFHKVWSDSLNSYVNFVEGYDYDIELAIFQEIVYQKTGKKLKCVLCCATKEDLPDIGLFEIPQLNLDKALKIVYDNLPRYKSIRDGKVAPNRCEQCTYCKKTKKARLISYELAGLNGDQLREEGVDCFDKKIIKEN